MPLSGISPWGVLFRELNPSVPLRRNISNKGEKKLCYLVELHDDSKDISPCHGEDKGVNVVYIS